MALWLSSQSYSSLPYSVPILWETRRQLEGVTVLLGGSRWVSHTILGRLASWVSQGMRLLNYWDEGCFLEGVVWSCESLERSAGSPFPSTGHEGEAKLARGLIPVAGPHSQACLPCQVNSGPLYLHLRWFTEGFCFILMSLTRAHNFLLFIFMYDNPSF